ncbi:MAG: aspartate--tRNA ligase [Rickettsiales bacterium]|jgi:aspartyl-tRNA synthetase|nr:aspartate--tRNA ligase [Rickettsiales bacterium]
MLRTHNCGQLNKNFLGQKVKLAGWVHTIRDHGSLVFIDLRDNYGITQCVVDREKGRNLMTVVSSISCESVVFISGTVIARMEGTINSTLSTGEIEVGIENITVESAAEQLPFQVSAEDQNYPEDLRFKYRYLDLRTKRMHRNITMRNKIFSFTRQEMLRQGFLEFQTPILTASSPEGARDFLVPSRIHPGKFYALPQAPQQFKQLLMIAGFDKYFQIAPCFRDEGTRADRILEFYQLDVEMSFVEQEDVISTMDPVLYNIFREFSDKKISELPFEHISYKDSMLKYGTDKPDLRNPLEITDVTDIFRNSGFLVFANAISSGSVVRSIAVKDVASKPRSFFDKIVNYAMEEGSKGLGYIIFEDNVNAKGPVAKFMTRDQLIEIGNRTGAKAGYALFFICNLENEAAKLAGKIRTMLGRELELINENEYKFCWIVNFPLYEINEETGKLDFSHNPFSFPKGGLEAFSNKDPLAIECSQYDCVCNGYEMCSGAIRNHRPEIMYKSFEMVGYDRSTVDKKFGGMINALRYGAPPHGGCAFGMERIVRLLVDEPNLREIVAFPPNGKGVDLMMGCPSTIDEAQLKELNIELSEKAKENCRKVELSI